ncbi:oligosaccharide flippase family protein, partial [candidate division NPL-UPA2 bacterium]|nr:oligosaccharide flippase family protein [candidate division NPL-UPA2 bacterium]
MNKINQFIDKLGSYFQLDLRYYIKNSFYLISAHAVSVVIGLMLSISFARFLPKETFGQYGFIMAIIGIVGIFTLPGMG